MYGSQSGNQSVFLPRNTNPDTKTKHKTSRSVINQSDLTLNFLMLTCHLRKPIGIEITRRVTKRIDQIQSPVHNYVSDLQPVSHP